MKKGAGVYSMSISLNQCSLNRVSGNCKITKNPLSLPEYHEKFRLNHLKHQNLGLLHHVMIDGMGFFSGNAH